MNDSSAAPAEATPTTAVEPTKAKPKAAKKPVAKKTPAKKKAVVKAAPKAAKKTSKKASDGKSKANRRAVFKLLKRHPDGLSDKVIREKIGMTPGNGHLGIILRGEVIGKRVSVGKYDEERPNVMLYKLTAKGREHLEKDVIEAWARKNRLVEKGRRNRADV